MKKFPEVNVSFEELYRILIGPIKSKLLLTGIEFGVFNHLREPRSAEAVAKKIGTHPVNTKLFLDGLAASDLVVKKEGLYQNTPVTQTFLVEGSPTSLGDFLTYTYQWSVPALKDMPQLVKEGPPPPSKVDMASEETWGRAAMFMANYQRAITGPCMAKIVSHLPEFLSFRKMLDLGGGPGLIGIAIVAEHPSMKGVIFDRPASVEVAKTFIKEYEMDDRIEVMGGDYTCDSIGEGYDLIWASGTFNFYRDNMDMITENIYDALNLGGVFASLSDGLTHERTRPGIMALGWMPMALMVRIWDSTRALLPIPCSGWGSSPSVAAHWTRTGVRWI